MEYVVSLTRHYRVDDVAAKADVCYSGLLPSLAEPLAPFKAPLPCVSGVFKVSPL